MSDPDRQGTAAGARRSGTGRIARGSPPRLRDRHRPTRALAARSADSDVSGLLDGLGNVLSVALRRDVSLDELIDLFDQRPEIHPALVRVANAPPFGLEGRITRIERAALILGPACLGAMMTLLVVTWWFRREPPQSRFSESLWLHSLATGLCAHELGCTLGLGLSWDACVAGLLHDLGCVSDRDRLPDTLLECLPSTLRESLYATFDSHCRPGRDGIVSELVRASHAVQNGASFGWSDGRIDANAGAGAIEHLGLSAEEVVEVRRSLERTLKSLIPVLPA